MLSRINARELFEQLHERLELRWLAGQHGGDRTLERRGQKTRRPSMAGYLNVIHPNKVQIIGAAELAWLDGLDARQRWEMLEKIMAFLPMALVIAKDQACPSDLRDVAEESGTPLWVSPRRGHELLSLLQYHMALSLAPRASHKVGTVAIPAAANSRRYALWLFHSITGNGLTKSVSALVVRAQWRNSSRRAK